MRTSTLLWILSCAAFNAQVADVVYTANQNDNTVSVIDADTAQKIGDIRLGYPAGDKRLYSPLYNGEINVHGLSYAPQRKELSIVSTVTNSVVRIDTDSGRRIDTLYVGRNPHEPRYTYDEKEIWVTVRGENHISVIDSDSGKEKQRIELASGPGMVAFSHDDRYAYISSSFDNHFWIVDRASKAVVKTLTLASHFSPFINTIPDGSEVWVDHKDIGKITRISTRTHEIIETFATGKISNHIGFANGKAYVTVGGENAVYVYDYSNNKAKLLKKIAAETLPHGIWASAQGDKVFFVNEVSDTLQVIDPVSDTITAKTAVGALPQALVYAANATGNIATLRQNIATEPAFRGPRR
ncbi:hypothetical protein DCF40_03750 [Edwardsiella piscicida]|uniref:YncE family protein n=1 Tax=Edwardsiella piscicida TaxID=1263550 RepID=UPI001CF3929F|nr:YncE family protein [Edwardsiella piscicida]UCQ31966.1 hypothetical protein DCF74_03755 [Edwardsiella piscicida]UCQ58289.1 hypothetical protein DCF40_03750 [Edwardsiella piscicida]